MGTPLIIGLTGPIAAGKSTVAALLAERGALIIDCDRLAAEVVAPGQPTLAAVLARFGPEYRRPDGALDRGALARRVFADPAELAALEALIHPAVTRRKDDLLRETTAPVAVIEAIRLIEAGYHETADAVWVVDAPAAVRLARLTGERGFTAAEARRRLAAQGDFATQRALADEVLVNDGDETALRRAVAAAWQRTVGDRG